MTTTIESYLGRCARIENLVKRQRRKETTAEENAAIQQLFIRFAAVYNDIMWREYIHRKTYRCEPDWKCKCPVHRELSSDCSNKLWRVLEYLDPDSSEDRMSAEWFATRGFKLVKSEEDSALDWVVFSSSDEVPIPDGLIDKAASWWVAYLESNWIGVEKEQAGGLFALYQPRLLEPITWTDEIRQKLQAEISSRLRKQLTERKAPEAFAPIEIGLTRTSISGSLTDACRAVGLGMPVVTSDATMFLSPSTIRVEVTPWSAAF